MCVVFYWCMLLYCCLDFGVFFFFFKQKTAYEMRISDWSSDVCSSDLATGSLGFADFRAGAVLQDRLDRILGRRLAGIAFGPEDGLAVIFEIGDELALLVLLDLEIMGHRVLLESHRERDRKSTRLNSSH